MAHLVYRQPARKSPIEVTPQLEATILEGLKFRSQQALARQLGVSQSAISRVARRVKLLEGAQ